MIKPGHFKGSPKKNMYRSYKNFNLDVFHNTLKMDLHSIGNNKYYTLFEVKFLHA